VVAGYANVGEFADTGGNGVCEAIVRDEIIDDGASPFDGGASVRGEQYRLLVTNHLLEIFEGEVVSGQVKSRHKSNSQLPVASSQLERTHGWRGFSKLFIVAEGQEGTGSRQMFAVRGVKTVIDSAQE
jgi:hypothetical protein